MYMEGAEVLERGRNETDVVKLIIRDYSLNISF